MSCISQQANSVLAPETQAPSILWFCPSPQDPEWPPWHQPPHPHPRQQEENSSHLKDAAWQWCFQLLGISLVPRPHRAAKEPGGVAFTSRGFITTHKQNAVGGPADTSAAGTIAEAAPHPTELGSGSLGLQDEARGLNCPWMAFPGGVPGGPGV